MSRSAWARGGFVGAAAAVLAAGCGRRELSGPPELRSGRDECAECGMLIHDDRAASAMLVERDRRREHLLFDDIGCMLDHERERGALWRPVEGFVHDHATREWVGSGAAVYLLTSGAALQTPMGSGIGAFAGRAGAEEAQGQFGGEIMDYRALAAARASGARERRSPDGGGP